jgi:hypothetical protein
LALREHGDADEHYLACGRRTEFSCGDFLDHLRFDKFDRMLRFLPLPHQFVVLPEPAPALSPSIEREVEAIWQEELIERGPRLFNGPLFSLEQISAGTMTGRFVEYRLFLAQMRHPELFAELQVQPLGVTGLLHNAEGLFFGYRSGAVAHQSNRWELIPAGGIDRGTLTEAGQIYPLEQLLTELEEEVGIDRAAIGSPVLVCFCEYSDQHVFDLVWELETRLDTASILHCHASLAQVEHTKIICLRWTELEAFLADGSRAIAAGTRDLLRHIAPQKRRV